MRKLFPVLISGVLAMSFSQWAAAQSTTTQGSAGANVGADVNKDKSGAGVSAGASTGSSSTGAAGATTSDTTKAGPTDNPNVTRDAQGREHMNKGKHKGERKHKKNKAM